MRRALIILLILSTVVSSSSAQNLKQMKDKLLRHVVLLKFKDASTPADIKKVEDAFRDLPSKIKSVKGFEWGKNNSPEKINQDYTHCFFVTFQTEKDRDEYLPHPAHKAFIDVLTPHLDKVLVIDYWTE